MPQINKLSATDEIVGGDLFPVYDQSSGDARKASASVLLEYIKANLNQTGYTNQSAVIASNDFNIQVISNASNIWLILNTTASFALGAITLPLFTEAIDGQEVMVFATRQVSVFSVGGNGAAAVAGAPTSLSADAFFTMKFNSTSNTWYRVA